MSEPTMGQAIDRYQAARDVADRLGWDLFNLDLDEGEDDGVRLIDAAETVASLEAKLDKLTKVARRAAERERHSLGFGPSTELELLLTEER